MKREGTRGYKHQRKLGKYGRAVIFLTLMMLLPLSTISMSAFGVQANIGTDAAARTTTAAPGEVIFWTQIGPANQETALQANDVQAAVGYEPFVSKAIMDGIASPIAWSTDVWPGSPSCILVVKDDNGYLNDSTHQALIDRVVGANIMATDWIEQSIADVGPNFSALLAMGSQLTSMPQSVVNASFAHIRYETAVIDSTMSWLTNYTIMLSDEGMITGFDGESSASALINRITNSTYRERGLQLRPDLTLLNPGEPLRVGYVLGDIQQLSRIAAMNASIWGGESLFERYGVEVTSTSFSNSASIMDAISAGLIDMAYLGPAPALLKIINANVRVQIVSLASTGGSALMAQPGLANLSELRGKIVATPGAASIQHLFLQDVVSLAGFRLALYGTITAPGAPLNLTAIPRFGRIELSWQPPDSDGGDQIVNYSVYRGNSSGTEVPYAWAGLTLRFNDTNVADGHSYYYMVKGVNGVGEGSSSSEANGTVPVDAVPPVVYFVITLHGVSTNVAQENQTLVFSANSSSDNKDPLEKLKFRWDLDDGTNATGPWVSHAYLALRTYFVTCTVTDMVGNSQNFTRQLAIVPMPRPDLRLTLVQCGPGVVRVGSQSNISATVINEGDAPAIAPSVAFYLIREGGQTELIGTSPNLTVDGSPRTSLDILQQGTFAMKWTPAEKGTFTLLARALVSEEHETTNNAHTATLIVEPALDLTPPQVIVILPSKDVVLNHRDVLLAWSALDNDSAILKSEAWNDSGQHINVTGLQNYTFLGLAEGAHILYLSAWDASGNVREVSVSISVDTATEALSEPMPWLPIGIIVVLGVALVLVLVLRKQRKL